MMSLNVKSNVKDFTRYLDDVQRKQVPFATARALSKTAQKAQKELQAAMPRTFNVTKKWWLKQQPTGIKIQPAKKADLEAVVFTAAYFAKLQEEGGIKIPTRRGILVPTQLTPKYGRKAGGAGRVIAGAKVLKFKGGSKRKTAGGVTTAAGKASRTRRRRGPKRTRPELASANPIATMPSGARGVFRRRGKKRLPIDRVYSYVPRARIRERMEFKARAYRTTVRVFDEMFAQSLSMALKTAR